MTITCQHCSVEIDPAQDPACVVYSPSGATDVVCAACRERMHQRSIAGIQERWGHYAWAASDYARKAAESRANELEAAITRYRDCGVEIERFSFMELENGVTHLCIDGVPRFSWSMVIRDGE